MGKALERENPLEVPATDRLVRTGRRGDRRAVTKSTNDPKLCLLTTSTGPSRPRSSGPPDEGQSRTHCLLHPNAKENRQQERPPPGPGPLGGRRRNFELRQ